jgi:hypothetical protein
MVNLFRLVSAGVQGASIMQTTPNPAINSDSKKRRPFVAPLYTAGYGER